jgi:hypothetical protein
MGVAAMGRLVKAQRWIKERFEKGSRPRVEQVREWVEAEELPGQIIGADVFVDADAAVMPRLKPAKLTAYDLLA